MVTIDGTLSLRGGNAESCVLSSSGGGGSGGSLILITTDIDGHGEINVAGGRASGIGTGWYLF